MESLLNIKWEVFTKKAFRGGKNKYLIDDPDLLPEVIVISFYGVDEFMEDYINEVGEDILDELALPFLIAHIKEHLHSKNFNTLLSKDPSKFGEFILVYYVNSFGPYRGHPEDPEEYDLTVDCVGILGKQVKLVY